MAIPLATARTGRSGFAHLREMRTDMLGYLEHLAAQGDLLRIGLGPLSAYFVNHPDYVREVLVTHASQTQKPSNVKYAARQLFGENLFTSDGEVWKVLRSTMQPAFHATRVNSYAAIMAAQTQALIAQWQDGATVELTEAMMQLTMGISTKTLFDVDLRDQAAGAAIVRFIELFNEQIGAPLPIPGWLPTKRNRELKRLIGVADNLLQPIIEERRAQVVGGEIADRGDVLSMLLRAQAADRTGILTDHQVRNEINNLFAAGYEVVGNTLAFTFYLLAQHEAVAAKAVAQIDQALAGRTITVADLPNLPYLELVIKESMRLLPVTTVLARQTIGPVIVGGERIPKGQLILVAPWTLHRHAAIYPDPTRFDPERFAPANVEAMPKHAYIPFAIGPRICLGNAFALLQLRINLATILQRYRLRVAPGYAFQPSFRFNMRPQGGLPMIVEARR